MWCLERLWDKLAVGDERKVIIGDFKCSRIEDKPSGDCTAISSSFLTQDQSPSYFTALFLQPACQLRKGTKRASLLGQLVQLSLDGFNFLRAHMLKSTLTSLKFTVEYNINNYYSGVQLIML